LSKKEKGVFAELKKRTFQRGNTDLSEKKKFEREKNH